MKKFLILLSFLASCNFAIAQQSGTAAQHPAGPTLNSSTGDTCLFLGYFKNRNGNNHDGLLRYSANDLKTFCGGGGGSGWGLTGNGGTSTPTNFIGTTDANGFNIATNDTIRSHRDSLGRELIPQTIYTQHNFGGATLLTLKNDASITGSVALHLIGKPSGVLTLVQLSDQGLSCDNVYNVLSPNLTLFGEGVNKTSYCNIDSTHVTFNCDSVIFNDSVRYIHARLNGITNGNVLTEDASGNWTSQQALPYTEYDAFITQGSTSAPSEDTVLFNNTGCTFTYSYTTGGTYWLTISGTTVSQNKIVVLFGGQNPNGGFGGGPFLNYAYLDNSTPYQIDINTYALIGGSLTDGGSGHVPIKIQIWK